MRPLEESGVSPSMPRPASVFAASLALLSAVAHGACASDPEGQCVKTAPPAGAGRIGTDLVLVDEAGIAVADALVSLV
ncbi:MAG TPA: hypothetical protein VM925_17815, partial [Labilithrix sp.]|nr:hypothetical protein [Labilithrix sp.]